MTPAEIIEAARQMLITTLLFVTPFLAASFGVGVLMGLIQGGTRMTDLTLSFVPRLAAVLLVLYLASGWVGKRTIDYFERSTVATIAVLE
jgi:flagellar biosynthesis protein FliQ